MAELADALDLESSSHGVQVQFLLPAPLELNLPPFIGQICYNKWRYFFMSIATEQKLQTKREPIKNVLYPIYWTISLNKEENYIIKIESQITNFRGVKNE